MTFLESLQNSFAQMIDYRKAVGYATTTYVSTIRPFIDFCGRNYQDSTEITKEMVDQWLCDYGYSVNTQAVFIACLRQYTKFINFLGGHAFVPDEEYIIHRIPYMPYIFRDDELEAFFDSVDSFVPTTNNKEHKPEIVLPLLFRMMYCCGMRPGEPLRLRCEDVNLRTGDIYIRETKRNKDRHIIMSEDMRNLCVKYDEKVARREWFFEHRGKPLETRWMTSQFHRCWKYSGVQAHGTPRPYDLRHQFASRNLMNWIGKGLDIMSLIPFLSAYMGHTTISSTLYYVHLLPENLLKSANIDWEQFSVIYKKDGDANDT